MKNHTKRSVASWILWLAVSTHLGGQNMHSPREVSFTTEDNAQIYGNLYGEGEHAVVLAHGAVFNKESWDPLAKRLAGEGLQVLAIDFRGYGKSKAGSAERALFHDVLGAVRYLQSEGARRVSVVGGSMGGGAAAQAAAESKPGEIDHLILLAAVPIAAPEKIKGDKLFVVSSGDGLKSRVQEQFNRAPDPKKLVVLEGSAHAQHIFKTNQSQALTKLVIDWLKKKA